MPLYQHRMPGRITLRPETSYIGMRRPYDRLLRYRQSTTYFTWIILHILPMRPPLSRALFRLHVSLRTHCPYFRHGSKNAAYFTSRSNTAQYQSGYLAMGHGSSVPHISAYTLERPMSAMLDAKHESSASPEGGHTVTYMAITIAAQGETTDEKVYALHKRH